MLKTKFSQELTDAEKQRLIRRLKENNCQGLQWQKNPDIVLILKEINKEKK